MTSLLLLIAGLVILAFAGDFVVQGAAALAKRFSIPDFLIGLTVIAFGTSAPELLVSLKSALIGEPQLAIGAVVGSNIANILLVLGAPALIAGTNCMQPLVRRNYGFLLAVTFLFIAFCLNGTIGFTQGAILFAALIAFIIISIFRAREIDPTMTSVVDEGSPVPALSGGKIAFFLLLGIIGLPLGANLTVDGALGVADLFALPKEGVGLVLLALGTSLPELAAAIASAIRRESGLIIGAVLGSNIFNILSIVGITAMVTPLPVASHFITVDVWIMLAVTLLLGPFVLQRATIGRVAGLFFLAIYTVFVYFAMMPATIGTGT